MTKPSSKDRTPCRCCTFCELSFTIFCSLLYLSFYHPIVFKNFFDYIKQSTSSLITNNTSDAYSNASSNASLDELTLLDIDNTTINRYENETISNTCEWTDWSVCDTPCGFGKQVREIDTPPCNFITETQDCYVECEPCSVTNWTDWSNCTPNVVGNCVEGTKTRTRSILSNLFCNANVSVVLNETRSCLFNCTQQQLYALNSIKLNQDTTPATELTDSSADLIQSDISILTYVIGGLALIFLFLFATQRKKGRFNLTIKTPSDTSKSNLDSPCERGQLMMLNPLMDFKSLKLEFTRATKLDKERKYAEAYIIYVQGSSILLSMRDKETNFKQRKIYTDYARSYIQRAEDIEKRYPLRIKRIKHNVNNFPLNIPTSTSLTVKTAQNKKQISSTSGLRNKESRNAISMTVEKKPHKYSPKKSSTLKPPPLLSQMYESETSDCEHDKKKKKGVTFKKQDPVSESSASSSDRDGDEDVNTDEDRDSIEDPKPARITPLGKKMVQDMSYVPPKTARNKIKTEFLTDHTKKVTYSS